MILDAVKWKTPHGQNCSDGEIKTRKMTAEEWKKYGPYNPVVRTGLGNVMYRQPPAHKAKATDEELADAILRYGSDRAGQELIAKQFGYKAVGSVYRRIKRIEDMINA